MTDYDSARLTNKDVLEFQALYKKEFGKDLSFEEAHNHAIKLVTLMKAVYKPMTVEQYETVNELDNKSTN